ncbi:hypothetical protein [Legionella bononiensis]|uniref:Uncharacterized protein n=1 Tax=Legionella bononiensis TaxID=2793102 RepID=A0ABS1WEA4_9GAMM|nr:hypothetical protein [Legionella bononiensis]MBL7479445.1 hypothetical protein [Legionella bononiensis]MBL7527682.1 hypothetical protein [Legionella bononiensis]
MKLLAFLWRGPERKAMHTIIFNNLILCICLHQPADKDPFYELKSSIKAT